MLDLLHRHMDSKGKQAKLKSPQELQDLLDVTRELLASMERQPSKVPAQGHGHVGDMTHHLLGCLRRGVQSKSCTICPIMHCPKEVRLTCRPLKCIDFYPCLLCHAMVSCPGPS